MKGQQLNWSPKMQILEGKTKRVPSTTAYSFCNKWSLRCTNQSSKKSKEKDYGVGFGTGVYAVSFYCLAKIVDEFAALWCFW